MERSSADLTQGSLHLMKTRTSNRGLTSSAGVRFLLSSLIAVDVIIVTPLVLRLITGGPQSVTTFVSHAARGDTFEAWQSIIVLLLIMASLTVGAWFINRKLRAKT